MPTRSTIRILILAALTLPALAQSTDPRQVLEDSARAISEIEGFSAKAVLSGDGSAIIMETLPSMNARINVGTHPEHGKMLHMLGQLRATQKAEPETFDISYTPSKYIWTDHEKKTVNIYPPSVSVRVRPRAFSYNLFANLLDDAPFDSQLDNPKDIVLEDNQTIAGQDCQVVYITRQDIKRSANASAHTHERWFISTADQLPRRLEQITDAGMIKATIIMELSDLTIAPQPESELMAFAPENYRVVDTTKKATPKPATQTPPTTRPANQQPSRPATPTDNGLSRLQRLDEPGVEHQPDQRTRRDGNDHRGSRVGRIHDNDSTFTVNCRFVFRFLSVVIKRGGTNCLSA